LISERDTLYGREILHTFTKEFQCPHILGKDTPTCLETVNKNELPDWIYTSTYLRGVDGGLPRAGSGEKSKTEDEKSGSNENAKAREVSKARERSFGHDQFDYLRRLAATLKNKDDDLRGRKKGRISAIGILGNDVFDKLLVLRALKPTFPDAVFFTTDYDATLAGQEELQWTRNLVIASTFGPILSARLQGDIPPFRSTYQTAAFLSAQLAVKEEGVKDVDLRNEIKDGVSRPRVFEIDRRGGAIALPIKVDLSDNARADNDGIHPKTADLYTKLHTRNTLGIIGILLLLAAIVSALCWNKMIFYFLRVTCIGLAVILLLGAGVIARWDYFAAAATEHGLGEPLAWTQGISVWPSIALRVIAAILAVCLILDAWREHQDNLKEVHAEFFAVEGKAADKPDAKFFGERPGPFSVTWDMLSYRLLESNERGRVRIGDAWKVYATKSALWPSVYRIAVYVLLMLMLFTFLTYLFEPPNVPWRGKLREVYQDVTTPVVFFMLILIFLVVDSTLLCLRFVDVLRKHETLWPRETHRPFERRLKFQDPLLDEWIDLNFIAKRTNCISKLIYFPFAIFALMIMARSTAFAEFALNVPIIATQAIAFAIIFGCALALCISAEKARETAKTRLTERLVAVRARIGSDRKVSQLEMLLKLVDNLRQGSFVPLSQQPPIRALLLPIGGLGWTALLDYRLLPGL
jgi:hypothetical protein